MRFHRGIDLHLEWVSGTINIEWAFFVHRVFLLPCFWQPVTMRSCPCPETKPPDLQWFESIPFSHRSFMHLAKAVRRKLMKDKNLDEIMSPFIFTLRYITHPIPFILSPRLNHGFVGYKKKNMWNHILWGVVQDLGDR